MVLRPDGRIIRFGLGSSGLPSSALWRMWVQGDETYLAVRTGIGLSKVSLHSTGHWALTAGTGRIPINGPQTLTDNWKAGPRVVFPGVPPILSLRTFEEAIYKRVFLFETPPESHWRDFAVVFSTASAGTDDLIRILPPGSDVIGPLRQRSGDGVWLATFATTMTSEQVEDIRTDRDKFRVTIRGDLNSLRSALALLIRDATNGDTMLININLGRENIVITE